MSACPLPGRPLRIGILTWEYPPAASGLPRAAREIAQALGDAGQDVRVLTLDRDARERDEAVEVVGRTVRPASSEGWWRRRAAIGHLVGPRALRRLVQEEHVRRPFDIVEATNWFAPGHAVASRGPVPLVTRNSTPAEIGKHARATLRDRLDGAFLDRMERRSARRSAALISNTQAHRERITRFYGLEDWTGTHAAIAPPVDPAILREGRQAPYPDGVDPIGFVFIGRPDHRKGFDAIAGALAILAAEHEAGTLPPFSVRLVGTAPAMLPPELREGPAAKLVVPLGRVADEAVRAELARAHAVLAPSRSESFGYVYQEAMAFGRPLVASAEDASARHFVGVPEAGLLAPATTPEGVATAMRRMITEPETRARLRRNALDAAGRCTREACARETLAVYRAVLSQRDAHER